MLPFYGIIHNQITYTISNEYYTKFKFQQFGFDQYWHDNSRFYVSLTGIYATWFFGGFIGIIYGILNLYKPKNKQIFKSIFTTLVVAFIFGFIGYIYGLLFINYHQWNFSTEIINRKQFKIVGAIHSFSYLGGLVGLIIGIFKFMKSKELKN